MRKNHSKKKLLTAAVMAALLAAPGYGHAFQMAPEYVYYNGKPLVEMQFLVKGEKMESLVDKAGGQTVTMICCGAITLLALVLIIAAAFVLRGTSLKPAKHTKVNG